MDVVVGGSAGGVAFGDEDDGKFQAFRAVNGYQTDGVKFVEGRLGLTDGGVFKAASKEARDLVQGLTLQAAQDADEFADVREGLFAAGQRAPGGFEIGESQGFFDEGVGGGEGGFFLQLGEDAKGVSTELPGLRVYIIRAGVSAIPAGLSWESRSVEEGGSGRPA